MNRPATLLDHSRRVQHAVARIAEHLDDPIELHALAEIACFSPHHFHLDDPGTVPASRLRSAAGMEVGPGFTARNDVHILDVVGMP